MTIGTFNTGLIYNQLIGLEGVKFDLTKMSWIGKAASDPRVFIMAQQSPVKTFEELRTQKTPVVMSTAGIGSASYVETVMLTNALRLPVKVVTGYNGQDDQLAMRRGEVAGSVASRSTYEQFVKNGFGRFVVQIGGNDQDVPQLAPLITDPAGKQLVALIQSQGDIARLTAGPPGIPAERLEPLAAAYRMAMEDKELQEKAAKLERPIEALYGEDVAKAVDVALNQTPETIAALKTAMTAQGPGGRRRCHDEGHRGRAQGRCPPDRHHACPTASPSRPPSPARAPRSPSPGRRPTASFSRPA